MKYANSTNGNTFPDEMEVNLHMFGALMLYSVAGEVDDADSRSRHGRFCQEDDGVPGEAAAAKKPQRRR
jgi:hypothetical protein